MAKKDEKTEDLFPQKRIPQIEQAYEAADKKRAEIEAAQKIVNNLKDELDPLEDALRIAIHTYEDRVDHQKTPEGQDVLIYKRDSFNLVVKVHERMSYDKVVARVTDESATPEGGDA